MHQPPLKLSYVKTKNDASVAMMTSFAHARFLETIASLRAIASAASANFVLGVETPSQQKLWILKGESFKGAVRIDAFDLRLEDDSDAALDDDHVKVETFDAADLRNDDSSPTPTKLRRGYLAPGVGDEGEVSSSVATLVDAASVEPLSAKPNAIDELDSEFINLEETSTVLQNVSNEDELTDNLRLNDENSIKTTSTTTSLPPRIRSECRTQGFIKRSHKCLDCGRIFTRRVFLDRHRECLHLKTKKHFCSRCNRGFYLASNLDNHFRDNHGDDKNDDESAHASGSLKNHIRVVHDKRRDHACLVCAKTFVLKGNLRRHLATAHNEGTESRHICGDCGKAFKLKHYLQQHYQMVHLKVTESCRKKILAKSMYMHLKSVHEKRPDDEWLKCDQCDKTFENHPKLSKHVEGVHRKLRHFECQLCQKRFKYAAVLAYHKKAVHDKIKDFACDICGKAFGKECYLRNHVRIVHERVQDFVCPLCDRKFSVKYNLRKHVRAIHERKQDYSCAQCGRTFNDRSNLNQHVKIVHYNIKRMPKKKVSAAAAVADEQVQDFVCPHCDKKFSVKYNLKKHVRAIHERRRDYSCAQCGRTFNDRSNLNQHVKIVHYNIKRTPKKKASAAAAAADVSSLSWLELAHISIEPEVFV